MNKVVLTGGAGFIGSNLVKALLEDNRVTKLLVIDNLSNGSKENIKEFLEHPKFEFVKEDIRNFENINELFQGYHLVCHQAALGSVPRSISDPITTNEVNVTGTLNVFKACVENNIRRVVLACSSSTYGDSKQLPKIESKIGNPLSPYAVTKYVNELYADVFQKVYGLEYIGLRYFNIFGPKQSPNNPYAAVIPIFCKALLNEESPNINGDGKTSRDFTFVENAVQANLLALFTNNNDAVNNIYNVACGDQTTLTDLVKIITSILGKKIEANYRAKRVGDVDHSLADISKITKKLGYSPKVKITEGLKKTLEWYQTTI